MTTTRLVILVMILNSTILMALPDSTAIVTKEQMRSRRQASSEFILGLQFSTVFTTNTPAGYSNPNPQDTSFVHTAFVLGLGFHFPLAEFSEKTALWFAPSFLVKGGLKSVEDGPEQGTGVFEFSVPFYVMASYGKYRRQRSPWSVEAGLGANLTASANHGQVNIVPSAAIDLVYAPYLMYRLRFQADLATYQLTPKDEQPYRQRAWSITLVYSI